MKMRIDTSATQLILLILCTWFPIPAGANVVGSDAQNFNPTTSGLDFVTVQSSETLEPGVFNLGIFVNYAKNTFPYYTSGTQPRTESQNSLTSGDFNLGVGFGKNWDAGVSFPVIFNQQIGDAQNVGHYSATGNTEIRANTKYRLFGNADHGLALVGSANFNRIANNPYVGAGGGPIYNLELAADTTVGGFALALNLGYRWRNAGSPVPDSGIQPLPNQFIGSVAFSYFAESIDSKIILEILSAFPEKSVPNGATDRENSVLEALLGIKYDNKSNFSLHLGAGQGLVKGIASPELRVYTGINYSFGGMSAKKAVARDPYADNKRVARAHPRKVQARPPMTPAHPRVALGASDGIDDEIADDEEVKPAKSVETVREVPVFNRGAYNHIVLKNLGFKSQSKELLPESERYMKQELIPALLELNHRRPIGSIIVEGHTDSLGAPAFNQALSLERAKIVATILAKSLPAEMAIPIQAVGMGSSSPIADNGNFQGRALNNRVEFKLMYRKSSR